jgi:hypothetical protein
MQSSLNASVNVMDMKTLKTFSLLLNQSHDQLGEWRHELLSYNQQLVDMLAEMRALNEQSALHKKSGDTLYIQGYANEFSAIKKSWTNIKAMNAKNLSDIRKLQTVVTARYYEVGDLQTALRSQVMHYSTRVFGPEYPYIWQHYNKNVDQQTLMFLTHP